MQEINYNLFKIGFFLMITFYREYTHRPFSLIYHNAFMDLKEFFCQDSANGMSHSFYRTNKNKDP